MQGEIKPSYLILGGILATAISNKFPGSIYMSGLGLLGLLCFVLGVVNGIVGLVKRKKEPQQPKK